MKISDRKTILRKIPYGLYILTAPATGGPAAALVSFVTQSSIDPPLLAVALKTDSAAFAAVSSSRQFALHFIGREQQTLAADFIKIKNFDGHRINGYEYAISRRRNLLLTDSPMVLELELRQIAAIGDHHLFIGEVLETHLRRNCEILTMNQTNWHYGG
ncbi:MAG: flavin reductase family protein [Candidatus Neomarinimicrobiota bacterium]